MTCRYMIGYYDPDVGDLGEIGTQDIEVLAPIWDRRELERITEILRRERRNPRLFIISFSRYEEE